MNETFFSQIDFVRSVTHAFENKKHILSIPVVGSGPNRFMFGTQESDNYGRQYISLAPFGLYASPGWNGNLETETLRGIIKEITRLHVLNFNWTVRFDHAALAEGLITLGLKFKRNSTHVLYLNGDYNKVFASFNATIRNQIRRAKRDGVVVREVHDLERIAKYHDIYKALVIMKGRANIYPVDLFYELSKIKGSVKILAAMWRDEVIAGGIFFQDGSSRMYWHGASDRQYSKLFPTCAILDYAIQDACLNGKSFFDFGSSIGITSLEQFKSFWGTEVKPYWEFQWTSPVWLQISSLKQRIKTQLRRTPRSRTGTN